MERQERSISHELLSVFWLCASLSSAGIAFSPKADAARATQEELSRSALQAEIGPSSDAERERRVRDSKERAASKKAEQPHVVSYATTVFSSGMTETDLQDFAETHGVEISRAEAKIPVDNAGIVFTMSIGSREILLRDGTFAERLKKAMGRQRAEFHDTAQRSTDEAEKQRFLTAAFALPILYYKIECVGQNSALADVALDSRVAAVFIRDGNANVTSYYAHKEMFASARRGSVPTIRANGRLEKLPSDPKIDPSTPIQKAP